MSLGATTTRVTETTTKEIITSKPVETTSSPVSGSTTKAPTVTIEMTTTGRF